MRQLGQTIGRCWRDQKQVGLIGQTDVGRFPTLFLVIEVGNDRLASQCLEGQRCDKALSIGCQHHVHTMPGVGQLAGQIDGLVSGDRSGDSEDDVHGLRSEIGHRGRFRQAPMEGLSRNPGTFGLINRLQRPQVVLTAATH